MRPILNLLLAAATLLPAHGFAQQLDLLIRNGSVLDGSGSPAIRADIGITGDRIVLIEPHIRRKATRVHRRHRASSSRPASSIPTPTPPPISPI